MSDVEPVVQIQEVSSVMTPEAGVSIYDAIAAAQITGYQRIVINDARSTATIVWFEKAD